MMKTTTHILWVSLLALSIAAVATAQDDDVDRVTVELTDPGEPVFLSVHLVNGGVTVNGYDGEEVIVEARARMRKLDQRPRTDGKGRGMVRIPVNSSSLSIEEYQNEVEIGTQSWKHPVDLVISVPRNTSLELKCVNQGDIKVEDVSGDLEVNNVNGSVTLLGISGSAIASAHNDDVTVTFNRVDPEKDMSFTSFNGNVDVSFPASLKAKVSLKTVHGDIYTDFDVEEIESPERIVRKNQRDSGGKYQVSIDRTFWGVINGGGQVIQFSNFNGDIFIRKQ